MSEGPNTETILEARFRMLAEQREREQPPPPVNLKRDVFGTLDIIDAFGEIGSLFTTKLVKTTMTFINLVDDSEDRHQP